MQDTHDAIGALSAADRMQEWVYCIQRPCRAGNVNRLYHRHEAVRRYSEVRWQPEYAAVGACYSELMGVVLAYSAFEYMRDETFRTSRPTRRAPNTRRDFYATLDLGHLTAAIQLVDEYYPRNSLHETLAACTNEHLSAALLDDLEPYEALFVPEAIRHTFVHGKLTPSSNGIECDTLAQVCSAFRSGLAALISAYMWSVVGAPIRDRLRVG